MRRQTWQLRLESRLLLASAVGHPQRPSLLTFEVLSCFHQDGVKKDFVDGLRIVRSWSCCPSTCTAGAVGRCVLSDSEREEPEPVKITIPR